MKINFRKRCINETEEFDFLKDIVANVEDSSIVVTVSQLNENDKSTIDKETESIDLSEISPTQNNDVSRNQHHKCSISTMLNDEPMTPPLNRASDVITQVDETVLENHLNNSSE